MLAWVVKPTITVPPDCWLDRFHWIDALDPAGLAVGSQLLADARPCAPLAGLAEVLPAGRYVVAASQRLPLTLTRMKPFAALPGAVSLKVRYS